MAELLQKFPCGCGIRRYADNSTGIDYCPKHKSAPYMYEALKDVVKRLDDIIGTEECEHDVGICWCDDHNAIFRANNVLAKAEGRTE